MNMNCEERIKLYELIEEHTRCEIVARLAPVGWQVYGDVYLQMTEKMNEIRKLMFGTSSLIELGERWNLLEEFNNDKKHKEKQRLRSSNKKRTKNKSHLKSHVRRTLWNDRRC